MERNAVGWFEVPVKDLDRAIKFYETVLDLKIEKHELGPLQMGWFPQLEDKPGSTGALVLHEGYVPSKEGSLLYFTAHSGDCSNELSRVEDAGGQIIQEKKQIGEYGFVGLIIDTEGNRVALHSRN